MRSILFAFAAFEKMHFENFFIQYAFDALIMMHKMNMSNVTVSDANCMESEALSRNLNKRFVSKSSGFMSDTAPLRECTESTAMLCCAFFQANII